MPKRRISKQINIGGVKVGGGAPITVQSMANTDTRDVMSTIRQIKELEEYGCEIIRVAVPDMEAAQALKKIKKGIKIPLIADIHFDYRLALAALESGVDGFRLNPGNIGDRAQIKQVVLAAKERAVPIRIGLNAGSLPKNNKVKNVATRMVDSAMEQVLLLESLDFDLIKISLKAFDVPTTIAAYKAIAKKMPYPLLIGITETGTQRRHRHDVIYWHRRYHPRFPDGGSEGRGNRRLRDFEKLEPEAARTGTGQLSVLRTHGSGHHQTGAAGGNGTTKNPEADQSGGDGMRSQRSRRSEGCRCRHRLRQKQGCSLQKR